MATDVLQMVIGLDYSSPSRGIDGKCNPSLLLRVCLSSNHVVSFKMFGMDHTVTVRIALLVSKAGAGKEGKANSHVAHVQEGLL